MQSNIDDLIVDYDFPDSWVELYNSGDSDINLRGYYISPTQNFKEGYMITDSIICYRGGYYLIYCDKKNTGVHANFRLDSGKGVLFLFDNKGNIVDSVFYPKMPAANIAWGRLHDGDENWQYELFSTPGISNTGDVSEVLLPDPVFSISGGIMEEPVTVVVKMPDGNYPEDTRVFLTLDGEEPTNNSISGTELTIDVDKTTCIRAKLLSQHALPKRSVTQSFIYHPRKVDLPIMSIVTNGNFLYDRKFGLLSKDTVIGNRPNYEWDWRRPVNVEYYEKKGKAALFNQICETSIQGGYSRKYNQKSLKLYAKKRFGTRRFYGSLWEDKPTVTACKSLTIRNGGQYCDRSRINDALIQKVFGTHLDNMDWQAYTPTIVYINGVYKGVYGLRERSDEDYIEANYDGLEDIIITDEKAYYAPKSKNVPQNWRDLLSFLSSDDVVYSDLLPQIDVDNFIKHTIAECYGNNLDYPDHNIVIWRPVEEDGKWRWIMKDLDLAFSYSPPNYKMLDYLFLSGDPESEAYQFAIRNEKIANSHSFYQKLNSFPEFRKRFVDIYSVCLGDFLKPSYMLEVLHNMVAEIYDEIGPTFEANDNMSDLLRFTTSIEKIESFIKNRPYYVYSQLAEFYSLGNLLPMMINTHNIKGIKMNGVTLTEGDYDGYYFLDHDLTLDSGEINCEWVMKIYDENGDIIYEESRDDKVVSLKLNNYPKGKKVVFEVNTNTMISNTYRNNTNNDKDDVKYYLPTGLQIEKPKIGMNIIRYSNGKVEKIIKKQ